MFRFMLSFWVVAFAAGCSDRGRNGECKSIKECTSNSWTYGTMEEPLCDVKGSDYKDENTKVCCY